MQRLTQRLQIVFKMTETFWKNSFIIAKDIQIIHVNFIVIAVTFSEKKLEMLHSYRSSWLVSGSFPRDEDGLRFSLSCACSKL
jgi:hypothetical protein